MGWGEGEPAPLLELDAGRKPIHNAVNPIGIKMLAT
jgi:hypothetical protein